MVRKVRKVHEQGMCGSANGLQIQLYNWFLAPQTLRKVYAFGLTMSYTCVCVHIDNYRYCICPFFLSLYGSFSPQTLAF